MVKSTWPGVSMMLISWSVPLAEGGGRGDGDAPLALEFHAVHERAHAVLALDVVHGVDALGVKEDPLGEGGFARVDVGADADVPDFADVFFHVDLPFSDEMRW